MPPVSDPAPESPEPRVAIVDADRRVQQSLAELLGVAGGLEVVGMAGDVRAALELVERESPSAVVIDPRLPDLDAGMALVAGIRRGWPEVRIVLTGWADETEGHAQRSGSIAHVDKSAAPEEFVRAVKEGCGCDEA